MASGIPTPPTEENTVKTPTMQQSSARKDAIAGTKVVKQIHRGTKRSASHLDHSPVNEHVPLPPHVMDNRHKRVWKACERCRMKKTKCDGEFPCKRCKDDGLVCTAGTRKKTEYKQIPRGYAEVLENTQFALISTVHKLYNMVRDGKKWDLGEPELNDRGQPIIHNIATKLGCIRPNADADLPPHSVFPEDEAGLAKLAVELDTLQQSRDREAKAAAAGTGTGTGAGAKPDNDANYAATEQSSPSESDSYDFESDYRNIFLTNPHTVQTMSPLSFPTPYSDFESCAIINDDASLFAQSSPTMPCPYPSWHYLASPPPMEASAFVAPMAVEMPESLQEALVEAEFGTVKPHKICMQNNMIVGVGDPMMAHSCHNMERLQPLRRPLLT
ncbi:hypothetical protein GGS21DRAFT_506305 [Xylaria nigripes]|nr:hypothetical protein GGS21DRAFT_506305 [Xylaria nigripes]